MQPPRQLVSADGRVPFGLFDGSVHTINGEDFAYRTPMGRPQGALARRFHYKQFQYFGMVADSVLAGCALAHTGWLGLAFVYVYDTRTRTMKSETFRLPLAHGLVMSRSPVSGDSRLTTRGGEIHMGYRQQGDVLHKTLSVRTAGGIRIDAELAEAAPFRPLAICTQTGINGWTYANKVAGVPVTGTIDCPLGRHDLATSGACGHHDFSAGYMRRETFWNWACLSGHAGGHVLGLNISCGVNETSHSENCLWLDGERVQTGLAQFAYERGNPQSPWRVTTADGAIDLLFTPAGEHSEQMDLKLFATNFHQFFGQFSGSIRARGKTIPVDGAWGFVEDQYAKW